MKRYRNIACILIVVLSIYMVSCAVQQVRGFQTWCVPNSVLCATTFAIKGYDTRIAIFHIEPGRDHAQAQALVDGKWCYLSEFWNGQSMEVRIYQRNCPETIGKEPYRYYTVTGFLEQQSEALGVGL